MIYLIIYSIFGIIFDLWIALGPGGWTESRLGRFGWILGFFIWPLFVVGICIDWILEYGDDKNLDG